MMFKHMKFKRILSSYIDNELIPDQRQLVEEHLKSCKSCRLELSNLKSISGALHQWKDEETSADFENKIKSSYFEDKFKEVTVMKSKTKLFIKTSAVALTTLLVVYVVITPKYLGRVPQGRLRSVGGQPGEQYSSELAYRKSIPVSTVAEPFQYETGISSPYRSVTIDGDFFTGGYREQDSLRRLEPLEGEVRPDSSYTEEPFSTESYNRIYENIFLKVTDNPLSTFSIDVDTASYSNIRRFIYQQQMPPEDSVRIEEMINYFDYDYPQPDGDVSFSITTEVSVCPWNKDHDLVMIGLQGKEIDRENAPPSNLVFLIDTSGSMSTYNKLPLLKNAFSLLTKQLKAKDRVSIVVYAGSAGLVLDSTSGENKEKILSAIENLNAGGFTAGGAGIKLAYKIAQENYIEGGNNRVILATDGDFNVGASSDAQMIRLIEKKRDKGVFLTVLGFGMGNYKDSKLEQIADKGNGNYAYIDNVLEARKVFVKELGSTLFTIAKDVKIQIEFNPGRIKAYRLIGYENRILAKEDFNDDTKDAGELGAGHTVTALYEIIPADFKEEVSSVDELKYQETKVKPSDELMIIKLRYKDPDSDISKLISQKLTEEIRTLKPSRNLSFASSVAEFGLLLRDSKFKADASYESVIQKAKGSKGVDDEGYRAEFIRLVEDVRMFDKR